MEVCTVCGKGYDNLDNLNDQFHIDWAAIFGHEPFIESELEMIRGNVDAVPQLEQENGNGMEKCIESISASGDTASVSEGLNEFSVMDVTANDGDDADGNENAAHIAVECGNIAVLRNVTDGLVIYTTGADNESDYHFGQECNQSVLGNTPRIRMTHPEDKAKYGDFQRNSTGSSIIFIDAPRDSSTSAIIGKRSYASHNEQPGRRFWDTGATNAATRTSNADGTGNLSEWPNSIGTSTRRTQHRFRPENGRIFKRIRITPQPPPPGLGHGRFRQGRDSGFNEPGHVLGREFIRRGKHNVYIESEADEENNVGNNQLRRREQLVDSGQDGEYDAE